MTRQSGRPGRVGEPADVEGQAVEGRRLAALVDGPWVGCWYWRDDLEHQQAAARDVHARGGTTELGDKAHYRPTDQWVDHPAGAGLGRAWTFAPPTDPSTSTEEHP